MTSTLTPPFRRSRPLTITTAVAALALPLLAACGSSDPLNTGTNAPTTATSNATGGANPAASGAIKVGSADFPESVLLGEIYAQALEKKGLTVERKFSIGSRENYLKALTGGEIDVIPEYTGSLLNFYDKAAKVNTPDEVYAALQKAIPAETTVLAKSAAEDKNSLAVTADTATEWSLKAIPDLAAHAGELSIAAPAEFKDRQQGLVGLKSVYNIVPAQFRPLASQAAVQALVNGQVKVANVFSTDPAIVANKLVVLEDPQSLFGSDNVVPLVLKSKASSEVSAALNAVSAKLDTSALASLVSQVVTDKKDAAEVAKAWIGTAGL